jgi:peptidoglycan-N-acetylglucosamine deacetylase
VKSGAACLLALACAACVSRAPAEDVKPPPSVPSAAPVSQCRWPGGAKAAVSLTYDDGLGSQLDNAVPVLNRLGVKATFFLSGPNIELFGPLAKNGHELASHTLKHPCHGVLAQMDLPQMAAELDAGLAAILALGVSGKPSFAYPCGQMQVKAGESYVSLVKERFSAARGVAPAVAIPEQVDLFNVPALFPPDGSDGSDVVSLIERAQASGGWAVIGVHGVDDDGAPLHMRQATHDKIVSYLAEHRAEVWTAPFGEVVTAVLACRQSATGK